MNSPNQPASISSTHRQSTRSSDSHGVSISTQTTPKHTEFDEKLVQILQQRFGFPGFRGRQLEIVSHVSRGLDALIVMPTGAGKSLCYQLPALARGFTIVVSPLLALMKDQVDALLQKGIRATFINSSISTSERRQRITEVQQGKWELLYVAPERFTPEFIDQLRNVDVRLLAIDEAHCLSQWGHDFRPDYLRLGKVRAALRFVPTIALTATATPEVQADIVNTLGISQATKFVFGFDRDNLLLEVINTPKDSNKVDALLANCGHGATLVYCATRKNVEAVTQKLRDNGVAAGMYHGGMAMNDRIAVQEAFMNNEISLVVATNAFGMGVDKEDVRCIIHWDFSSTIEGYYQEIGRAGRDGKLSKVILLYRDVDRQVHEFFIKSSYPDKSDIESVWQAIRSKNANPLWIKLDELAKALPGTGTDRTAGSCLYSLQREGYIRRIHASERAGKLRLTGVLPEKELQGFRGLVYRSFVNRIGQNYTTVYSLVPEEQALRLDMNREQYMAVLRALQEQGYIDWDSPERMGGIEILREEHTLDIDEAKILARREFELKKVDLMRSYSRSACRRRYLIEYFGQEAPWERCGTCDQCQIAEKLESGEIRNNYVNPSQLLVVRKILSCVARMEQHASGKWFASTHFSPNWIAEVLVGDDKRIKQFGFHNISTFGILPKIPKTVLMRLLDELFHIQALDERYVTREMNGRQITYKEFGLADVGKDIMQGLISEFSLPFFDEVAKKTSKKKKAKEEEKLSISTPNSKQSPVNTTSKTPSKKTTTDKDTKLFEELRIKRSDLAKKEQIRPYHIASDQMLHDIVEHKPTTLDALSQISGMGAWRLQKYGTHIIDVVNRFL